MVSFPSHASSMQPQPAAKPDVTTTGKPSQPWHKQAEKHIREYALLPTGRQQVNAQGLSGPEFHWKPTAKQLIGELRHPKERLPDARERDMIAQTLRDKQIDLDLDQADVLAVDVPGSYVSSPGNFLHKIGKTLKKLFTPTKNEQQNKSTSVKLLSYDDPEWLQADLPVIAKRFSLFAVPEKNLLTGLTKSLTKRKSDNTPQEIHIAKVVVPVSEKHLLLISSKAPGNKAS